MRKLADNNLNENFFYKLIRYRDFNRLRTLCWNIYRHRIFSFNPNTRGHWNHKLSQFDGFWRDENYYHILDLLPNDSRFSLLDVGCAIGDGCRLLQERFPQAEITGLDISDVGIEKARKNPGRIRYLAADILTDSLPDTYDYITVIETLEHFDNPFRIIDKLLKYAKRSIILSTPYTPDYTGKIKGQGEHIYAFNEETFKDRGYDYRVVKITDFVNVTESRCIIYEIFPR